MECQIPLHLPQALPANWNELLASSAFIPSEQQLTREDRHCEEFYRRKLQVGMDLRALISAAMHAFSSTAIPQIAYAGRGSFNHVFSLEFPDGFRVAARLPLPTSRCPDHIESTVAMMTMARCYAGILAPEVYAWYSGNDSPVRSSYILMEWVDGMAPWEDWHNTPSDARADFLKKLAVQHATFAQPLNLPFQGIGSLYFADFPPCSAISFNTMSAYRIGPLSQGPVCAHRRGETLWPKATMLSLRDFWLGLWQHEVDTITKTFGLDRSTVLAMADNFFSVGEPSTLGDFFDVAQALKIFIQKCPLPTDLNLMQLCFVPTDLSFGNIKVDRKTREIKAFIDWDDVYLMPFLLCSGYPVDICSNDGLDIGDWSKHGYFRFLPFDEEAEEPAAVVNQYPETVEAIEKEKDNLHPQDSVDNHDHHNSDDSSSTSDSGSEIDSSESHSAVPSSNPLRVGDKLDEDPDPHAFLRFRVQDTKLRRLYEGFLVEQDPRFGVEGFWDFRRDPLIIQHLVTYGWLEWLKKDEWLKDRAAALQSL